MAKQETCSVTLRVELPMLPNFLRLSGHKEYTVDVGDVSEEELQGLADRWTEALLEHARNRRTLRAASVAEKTDGTV